MFCLDLERPTGIPFETALRGIPEIQPRYSSSFVMFALSLFNANPSYAAIALLPS